MQQREVSVFDEDPLYDSVASDEDYATVPEDQEKLPQKESPQLIDKDSAISLHNVNTTNQMLKQLTNQLKNSDNTITDLKSQILKLRQHIESLENENSDLKNRLSHTKPISKVNGDSGFDSLGFISEVIFRCYIFCLSAHGKIKIICEKKSEHTITLIEI